MRRLADPSHSALHEGPVSAGRGRGVQRIQDIPMGVDEWWCRVVGTTSFAILSVLQMVGVFSRLLLGVPVSRARAELTTTL